MTNMLIPYGGVVVRSSGRYLIVARPRLTQLQHADSQQI